MEQGIYVIQNLVNDKMYIGSSINTRKRKNRHFSELKRGVHKNRKLQSSYNKYGKDNFSFRQLETVEDKSSLIEREQYYIDTLKPELNINLVANSSLGVKRSEDTKEKVRQANLGLKHPAWRNAIKSKAQGGKNHWTQKKKFTKEAKKRMSKAHKELYRKGYDNPNCVAIEQLTLEGKLVKEWKSAYHAARHFGCTEGAIRNNMRGKSKSSQGYLWRYKE